MGDVQTYFYLALISVIMIGLILLFVFIAARGLRRWYRQVHGETPLTFWLIGGAITALAWAAAAKACASRTPGARTKPTRSAGEISLERLAMCQVCRGAKAATGGTGLAGRRP